MTNEDIINCKNITSMSEDMVNWLFKHYTEVEASAENLAYKWETACRAGNDWKYGRFKVCREKMLWRGLTFSEFYGNGIVD